MNTTIRDEAVVHMNLDFMNAFDAVAGPAASY
jgi:hypothetical protein